ncbi:MAG: LysM peptidoglycan-binding domain-containing protein, partial [Methyloprofundus sp.]
QVTAKNPVYNKPIYKVKAGDNLWGISKKLGLSSKEIAQWNQIELNSTLSLGQTLVIKQPTNSLQPSKNKQSIQYTVRRGDSLYAISEKFNVRVADLRKWNSSTLGKFLKPGQTIIVRNNPPST